MMYPLNLNDADNLTFYVERKLDKQNLCKSTLNRSIEMTIPPVQS